MPDPKLPGNRISGKDIYGAYGTKAAQNKTVIDTLDSIPEPPPHLTPEGKAEWNQICGLLLEMGQLTKFDRPCLEGYMDAWDVGETTDDMKIRLSANAAKLKWLVKLGLTTVHKFKHVATADQVPSAELKGFAALKGE